MRKTIPFSEKNRKILHNKCGNCGFPFSPLLTPHSSLSNLIYCLSYHTFPVLTRTQKCASLKAQMKSIFRAGCNSPPAVTVRERFGAESVKLRYRQYSLDGRRYARRISLRLFSRPGFFPGRIFLHRRRRI